MKDYFEYHLTVDQVVLYDDVILKGENCCLKEDASSIEEFISSLDTLVDSLIQTVVDSYKCGYNDALNLIRRSKIL